MNRKELNDILKNHKKWLAGEEGVGADLGYSCLPLWCGSLEWDGHGFVMRLEIE